MVINSLGPENADNSWTTFWCGTWAFDFCNGVSSTSCDIDRDDCYYDWDWEYEAEPFVC